MVNDERRLIEQIKVGERPKGGRARLPAAADARDVRINWYCFPSAAAMKTVTASDANRSSPTSFAPLTRQARSGYGSYWYYQYEYRSEGRTGHKRQ